MAKHLTQRSRFGIAAAIAHALICGQSVTVMKSRREGLTDLAEKTAHELETLNKIKQRDLRKLEAKKARKAAKKQRRAS